MLASIKTFLHPQGMYTQEQSFLLLGIFAQLLKNATVWKKVSDTNDTLCDWDACGRLLQERYQCYLQDNPPHFLVEERNGEEMNNEDTGANTNTSAIGECFSYCCPQTPKELDKLMDWIKPSDCTIVN
jgi:hypothetical protein